MGLTVRDVWQMEKFRSFRLAAGEGGLSKEIANIGILDYEYVVDEDTLPEKWSFGKKDFLISSLLFAKDHPERILDALKGLVRDKVSALAVKTVCYQELPEEAIQYADENDLPIFLFGREDAYFEEIVFEIKEKIASWNDAKNIEKKLDLLIAGALSSEESQELFKKMFRFWRRWYVFLYEREEADVTEGETARRCRNLAARISGWGSAVVYHGGYLVFLTEDKKENLSRYVKQFLRERKREGVFLGAGSLHRKEEEIRQAVQESIYALEYGKCRGAEETYFDKMGICQILMPHRRDRWMREYSRRILEKIRRSDQESDGELFETLRSYVEASGDIQQVSETMHVHKNTIRYRMNRVRDLLDMTEDPTFFQQICAAVMIYELDPQKEGFFEN